MEERDREPIATIALIAALAHGDRSPEEIAELNRIAGALGGGDYDRIARRVLTGQARLGDVAASRQPRAPVRSGVRGAVAGTTAKDQNRDCIRSKLTLPLPLPPSQLFPKVESQIRQQTASLNLPAVLQRFRA